MRLRQVVEASSKWENRASRRLKCFVMWLLGMGWDNQPLGLYATRNTNDERGTFIQTHCDTVRQARPGDGGR